MKDSTTENEEYICKKKENMIKWTHILVVMTALKKYFIILLFLLLGVGTLFLSPSISSDAVNTTIIGITEVHANT